jgi:hypothetical protein
MRASELGRSLLLVAAAPLMVGACLDDHLADDCNNLGTCPLPGPPACEGTCVAPAPEGWTGPFLVRLGDDTLGPSEELALCESQAARFFNYGVAPPPLPTCGDCACDLSTGSCAFPATLTANTDQCPGTAGSAFDAPGAWDGTCTTFDAIPAGEIRSVTVAPLMVSESGCVPVASAPEMTQNLPSAPTSGLACQSHTDGVCSNNADACLPSLPHTPKGPGRTWTYCVNQEGAGGQYNSTCPLPFPKLYVFAESYTDLPACSPCTCGSPEGSACSSQVSIYSDGACTDLIGSVKALSSGPMCVDVPASSPVGSKTATQPTYEPGACAPDGGTLSGLPTPVAPWTYCCQE